MNDFWQIERLLSQPPTKGEITMPAGDLGWAVFWACLIGYAGLCMAVIRPADLPNIWRGWRAVSRALRGLGEWERE